MRRSAGRPRVEVSEVTEVTVRGVEGLFEKVVTKFGTGAKIDCPKKYLGKAVYVVVRRDPPLILDDAALAGRDSSAGPSDLVVSEPLTATHSRPSLLADSTLAPTDRSSEPAGGDFTGVRAERIAANSSVAPVGGRSIPPDRRRSRGGRRTMNSLWSVWTRTGTSP